MSRLLGRLLDFITFRHMSIRRKFTLFTLGVSFWYWVIGAAGIFHQPDWTGRLAIGVALLVAHALLITFAWTAAQSFTQPIHAMYAQVREITAGDLHDLHPIRVSASDEVGELTKRFNVLIQVLRDLAAFKGVIEHDDSAADVYGRLSDIFRARGLVRHQVLTLEPGGKGLRVVAPTGPEPRWCAAALGESAAQCRAFKTAAAVNSEIFPGVCRLFEVPGADHCCLPLILGGTTGGVVQFVFGGAEGPSGDAVKPLLEMSKRFVTEALPVLQARRLTDTLRESALRDGLTGMFNRRYLEEVHGQVVALTRRRQSSLGVVLCDVDHFKQVNDQHGHAAGDAVLRDVAATLAGMVRASDVVVRYGGEEFLLLLHDTPRDGAVLVAERARAALHGREVNTGAAALRVTLSAGVTVLAGGDASLWDAIRRADEALYQAKRGGRNRVVAWAESRIEAA